MAAAYFVCHIGPIFQISLIYAFIGSNSIEIVSKRRTPFLNGGSDSRIHQHTAPQKGSASRIHQHTAQKKGSASRFHQPKGGPLLDSINQKGGPPKWGLLLEFINQRDQRGSASRFHQPKGGPLVDSINQKGTISISSGTQLCWHDSCYFKRK